MAGTDEEHRDMVRNWDALESRLAQVTDIGEYLNEDVLEITREQYLSDGKWITKLYTLVTGIGGPHIEFNTNHLLAVYSGGGVHEYTTYDKRAIKTIDAIGDYLDDAYGTESR